MSKGKNSRTDGESKLQKARTYKNQARRYRALIEKFPQSKDRSLWEKEVAFYEAPNK